MFCVVLCGGFFFLNDFTVIVCYFVYIFSLNVYACTMYSKYHTILRDLKKKKKYGVEVPVRLCQVRRVRRRHCAEGGAVGGVMNL